MRSFIVAAALTVSVASPAFAVSVQKCSNDGSDDIANIAEPWEQNSHAYYNGDVRVVLTGTGVDLVSCSSHLVVLVPVKDETGEYRECFVVNEHEGMGFAAIDFAHLTTRYDAGKGLLISFPYTHYNVDGPGDQHIGKV